MKSLLTVISALIIYSTLQAQNGSIDTFASHSYTIYKFRKSDEGLVMCWKDKHSEKLHSLKNLKVAVEGVGRQLVFATNGGMYTKDNSPVGLYIENGREMAPMVQGKEGTGNFFIQPNGVFFITKTGAAIVTTPQYDTKQKVLYATQSGPMLVVDGTINGNLKEGSANLNIRSGVGVDQQGNIYFAISNLPVNFYDFASLFKEKFHCPQALYLDGAISKMYLPAVGRNELDGDFGVMIGVIK